MVFESKFKYCENAQFTLGVWGINFICYFDGVMGKKLKKQDFNLLWGFENL